jgi:hypothetical protein
VKGFALKDSGATLATDKPPALRAFARPVPRMSSDPDENQQSFVTYGSCREGWNVLRRSLGRRSNAEEVQSFFQGFWGK